MVTVEVTACASVRLKTRKLYIGHFAQMEELRWKKRRTHGEAEAEREREYVCVNEKRQ